MQIVRGDDKTFSIERYDADGKLITDKAEELIITCKENAYTKDVIFQKNLSAEDIEFKDGVYSFDNFIAQYVTKAEIDLSGFTECRYAFSGCKNLESLVLNGTEDGAILYANYMFQDCTELKEVPSFNSSNVTALTSCFSNCKSLKKITEFDTGKATEMREMFNECIALEEICELDCKNNKNVQGMFYNNSSLKTLGGLKDIGKAYTGSSVNYASYNLNLTMSSNLTKQSLLNVINGLYDLASHNKPAQGLFLGDVNLAKLTAEEIAIATNKGWNVS